MLVVQSLKVHSHTQRDHISLIFCNMSKAVILQLDWIYAEVLLLYPAAVLLQQQHSCVINSQYFTLTQGCNIEPVNTAHLVFSSPLDVCKAMHFSAGICGAQTMLPLDVISSLCQLWPL